MGKPPLCTSQESAPALPLHIAVVNNSLSGPGTPGRLPASGRHKTVFVKVSRCCQEASGSISYTHIGT